MRPAPSSRLPHAALLATAALAALAASATPAHAQRHTPPWERRATPTFAVGGAGVYAGPRGSDATRVQDGYGFDVHAAVGVSAFALAGGYQRSIQSLRDTDTDVTLQGPYVEPRIALAAGGSFTPYLTGRVAFLRQSVRGDAVTVSGSTRTAVGGGLGMLVTLGPAVHLDLAAQYTRFDVSADTRQNDGALLRAGLVFGFDRWGR
jgi:opacity protein-like surface antigen